MIRKEQFMLKRNKFIRIISVITAFVLLFTSLFGLEILGENSSSLSDTPQFINASYSEQYEKYDYTDIDWASFGTNLISDPTVACFADGKYKSYYDPDKTDGTVLNANAWWDKAPGHSTAQTVTEWKSVAKRGYVSSASADSHTADGSGAIVRTRGTKVINLAMPKMGKYKFYVVTFWLYTVQQQYEPIKFGYDTSSTVLELTAGYVGTGWKRVTMLVYTGNNTFENPYLQIGVSAFKADDFAVYELDEEYGQNCVKSKKLVSAFGSSSKLPDSPQYINASYDSKYKEYDYADIAWDMLGENLIPDPTVSCFDSEGEYNTYYDPTKTDGTVFNANAWWDKAADYYNGKVVSSPLPYWQSAKDRGLISNDTSLSHSADGSGAIVRTSTSAQLNLSLPKMESYSFYAVTFWLYTEQQQWQEIRFGVDTSNGNALQLTDGWLGTGWNRVTMLIYTGNKALSNPYIQLGVSYFRADDFAVYKLDNSYGIECINEKKMLPVGASGANPMAAASGVLEWCEFDEAGNLYTNGSFEATENSVFPETGTPMFGRRVLKVGENEISASLPKLSTNTYYMLSVWIRTEHYSETDKVKISLKAKDATEALTVFERGASEEWIKVGFMLYTAYTTEFDILFEAEASSAEAVFYADGAALVKLSDELSAACYAMDTYPKTYTDLDRLETAKDCFESNPLYKELNSPILSTDTVPVNYAELWARLSVEYDEQDRLSRGFAASGYGFRNNLVSNGGLEYTCADENNLFEDASCSNQDYWFDENVSNEGNYASISTAASYEGNSSLKVAGNGIYRKKITGLKANSFYILSLWGMSDCETTGDINFGFMDSNKHPLENPLTESQSNNTTYSWTLKQTITIQSQDGTWYQRVYRFNTGNNTELEFFVTGSLGEMYLDDIRLYEEVNAITIKDEYTMPLTVLEYDEANSVCDDNKNLIENGDFSNGGSFWNKFKGFDTFVEVATSEGNPMLHFKSAYDNYYYLSAFDVSADKMYTLSYWTKNLNGEGSKSGVVLLDEERTYISEISDISDGYGKWKRVSIRFKTIEDTTVSLGIYDNGGEAVFDKLRLFESEDGYALGNEDVPVGGDTFTDSKLGSDGVYRRPSENNGSGDYSYSGSYTPAVKSDTIITDDVQGTEDTVTTTTVIKRYKKGKKNEEWSISPWVIAAIVAGGTVVLAGTTLLIVFGVRRKKKKNINIDIN